MFSSYDFLYVYYLGSLEKRILKRQRSLESLPEGIHDRIRLFEDFFLKGSPYA